MADVYRQRNLGECDSLPNRQRIWNQTSFLIFTPASLSKTFIFHSLEINLLLRTFHLKRKKKSQSSLRETTVRIGIRGNEPCWRSKPCALLVNGLINQPLSFLFCENMPSCHAVGFKHNRGSFSCFVSWTSKFMLSNTLLRTFNLRKAVSCAFL